SFLRGIFGRSDLSSRQPVGNTTGESFCHFCNHASEIFPLMTFSRFITLHTCAQALCATRHISYPPPPSTIRFPLEYLCHCSYATSGIRSFFLFLMLMFDSLS